MPGTKKLAVAQRGFDEGVGVEAAEQHLGQAHVQEREAA